jgi:hypothetical protein
MRAKTSASHVGLGRCSPWWTWRRGFGPTIPLRAIRRFAEAALESLTAEFSGLYSGMGRPSIAPETGPAP